MIDKQEEVAFLSDSFDIPPRKAAELVAASAEEAEVLEKAQLEAERNRNPYGDVPVPKSPEEHEVTGNGGMQKTVLRRDNKASITGP
jgi:hypothetical protein